MCFQTSFCYDMLCCHQCQRGRLLDTIDNCVLSLMLHKCHIRYQSFHQAQTVCNAIYSVNRAHSVIEGNLAKTVLTEVTWSSKKMKKTVLIELTRSSKKMKKTVLTELTWSSKKMKKTVLTELTRSSKEIWQRQF